MDRVSVVMAGIGGYGEAHLDEILHSPEAEGLELVGAVDPRPEKSRFYGELCERKIPVYGSLEEFYAVNSAQMAILATPTYFHASQSVYCMEHGSDVLCEKPLCVLPEDAETMMEARDRTGRRLGIGFQWSFSNGILALKRDIMNGIYGKIRRIRTIVLFPRDMKYYHRSSWPGRRCMPSGEPVLDSVVSNATAHYLHNMLFLMGNALDRSAEPVRMQAEVYRANPIEMFDTCALRLWTEAETELFFTASHAIPKSDGRMPEFIIEGERGTVTLYYENGQEVMEGKLIDGNSISYSAPSQDRHRKIYALRDAILREEPLVCVPETALPHVKCVCGLAESFPETPVFPEERIRFLEETDQYVCEGLTEILNRCWEEGKLISETGVSWAYPPHEILIQNSFSEN